MLHRVGYALVVLLVLTGLSLDAWAAKVGPQFRVNTTTLGTQLFPSVAKLSNGDFVVTWHSYDGWAFGVYGQRYSAAGARLGSEFQVNTYTTGDQVFPAVAGLSTGGFVVTWMSYGQDGSNYGVYGQLYSAAGARLGSEFQVNTYSASAQWSPSVAGLNNGFVVTWISYGQDGWSHGVYGQRYNAVGARVGSEFRVSTYTPVDMATPSVSAVAKLRNGGFVVTWESYGQDGDGYYGVYAQRYNAAGARLGSEFEVNSHTFDEWGPSVAGLNNGSFVVTREAYHKDGSGFGIYGQRYAGTGVPLGSEFRVNTHTANEQRFPSVAALSNGGFVVIWNSYGQDRSGYGVYGQRYSAKGAPVGGEFRVNKTTAGDQERPSVAALGGGDFVVTWASDDGSFKGIFGQRFSP